MSETVKALLERQADRRRKRRIRTINGIASVALVIFCVGNLIHMEIEDHAEAKDGTSVPVVSVQAAFEAEPEPVALADEEPVEEAENELIEAALIEQGYIRADIPLDSETQLLLRAACDETGIEYELALAVIWRETDFRNITGDDGESCGYMQIQQKWHSDRMERLGVTDLADPYSNFRVGCDFLAELIDRYEGDVAKALTTYNQGHYNGTVTAYAKDVLEKYEQLVVIQNENA